MHCMDKISVPFLNVTNWIIYEYGAMAMAPRMAASVFRCAAIFLVLLVNLVFCHIIRSPFTREELIGETSEKQLLWICFPTFSSHPIRGNTGHFGQRCAPDTETLPSGNSFFPSATGLINNAPGPPGHAHYPPFTHHHSQSSAYDDNKFCTTCIILHNCIFIFHSYSSYYGSFVYRVSF